MLRREKEERIFFPGEGRRVYLGWGLQVEFQEHLIGVMPYAQSPGSLIKRGAPGGEGKCLENPTMG